MQVIDSSTEDDLDTSNCNNLRLTPRSKPEHNIIQQSTVTVGDYERNWTLPSCTSNRKNPAESTRNHTKFTGSGRPNLVGSDLLKRSGDVTQLAECIGSGRTGLIGSEQSSLESKSALAAHPGKLTESCSHLQPVNLNSIKFADNVRSSSANKETSGLTANDVATFSLAFDDFFDSEGENDAGNQEFTQLKAPKDRISTVGKSDDDSSSVGFSQVVETPKQCVLQSGCSTVLGRPGLSRSGQPSSKIRSVQTTVMSAVCSSTVPRVSCTTGSVQPLLTGSQRPSSVTNLAQSEAERLREERIRLSRQKKEEFQRKFRNVPSNVSQAVSSSVDTGGMASNMADHLERKLRILVDSRELTGAQVNCVSVAFYTRFHSLLKE